MPGGSRTVAFGFYIMYYGYLLNERVPRKEVDLKRQALHAT